MKLSFLRNVFLVVILQSFFLGHSQIKSCEESWFEGEGTHYGGIAGGAGGHCGLPIDSGDIYHCAMNHEQYDSSASCGSCVRILGPKGEVTLKVADECPECEFGDIDLTTAVYPQIAELKDGRVKIKWRYVPCPLANDIVLLFASGSGPYYFKVQVRDSFYPIYKLEYKDNRGDYIEIDRVVYNYFVAPSGIDEDKNQAGPYDLRFTSSAGEILEVDNIHFNTSELVHTGVQFTELKCPDCFGDTNGLAELDFCDVCSGGNTGIEPNSLCEKDCAGYWNENAYIDGCGNCVGGTTGRTPCDKDCNNAPGGLAYVDKCGECAGGNTGLLECIKDCNNDWGGNAQVDSCGNCTEGNTAIDFESDRNNCVVNIHDNTKACDIELYPNPFFDRLNMKTEGYFDYQVSTVSGNEVRRGKAKNTTVIGEELMPGVYLLTIRTKGTYHTFRVVKIVDDH